MARTNDQRPDSTNDHGANAASAVAGEARALTGNPAHPKKRSRKRRWLAMSLRLVLVGTLLIAGLLGITAFRLSHGPVSLSFLVPMLERAISAELGGRAMHMRDAQVLWGERGPEVQVIDLRVTEPDGAQVLQAPLAVATLSMDAGLRGRLALRRIALVNPRLQAFYTEDGTLSVKFANDTSRAAATASLAPPAVSGPTTEQPQGQFEFVRAVTAISAQARRREHASAYLQEVGLQQATLIVDNGRRKTLWKVPELKIDLSHKSKRSLISGHAKIDSLSGPWSVDFQTAEAEASDKLAVDVTVSGANPRGLARQVLSLAAFEKLDLPLDGQARLELTPKGRVESATFSLRARPGQLLPSSSNTAPCTIEAGSLQGSYDPKNSRFIFSDATLSVDRNQIALAGELQRTAAPTAEGMPAWTFAFASKASTLAPLAPHAKPLAIDVFRFKGQAVLETGRIGVDEFELKASGAAVTGTASIGEQTADGTRATDITARIAPMTIAQALELWPATISPSARAWLAKNVKRGQIAGGGVKAEMTGETKTALTLELTGTEVAAGKDVPAIDIPRGLLRVDNGALEFTAPDINIGNEGKRLLGKNVRVTVSEPVKGQPPVADLAFRLMGPLAAAVDIADREPLRLLKSRGIALPQPEGRLDGQLKVSLPLTETIQASDARLEGRIRLMDGRFRQLVGQHDLTGVKVDLDISDSAVDVRGDMLVKGVPLKLVGQHLLNTSADKQAPFRLTLKLDDSDRSQLGLDINDIVAGEVPIEILVGPDGKGGYQASLTGDLTKAELMLDSVSYKKPPGVQARVQFTPAKAAQGRLELRGFKLVGSTIAADGIIILGADGKARELAFPEFSLNLVTRLDVQGKLRPDNIWDVKARGLTFDGRELFRDLFNVQNQAKLVPKDKPGLDLTADIDTVLGFSDTNLKGLRLTLSRRNDNGHEKTVALKVNATHESGKPFEATIVTQKGERKLSAASQDAGQTFKLVGFYPNAVGGRMGLEVSLDGQGFVERNGVLKAEAFAVLGDPVVSEMFQNQDSKSKGATKRIVREKIDFDWMTLPFSVGCGQFVMNDMEIRGPLLGASMRGKADFKAQKLQMGGTYVPLSGLNSAIGVIPGIGQLLTGPKGEGIFGITFAVIGPMSNPEVLINPLSGFLPGILRETQQLTPQSYKISPCTVTPAAPVTKPDAARASSSSPASSSGSAASGREAATPRAQSPGVITDWSSDKRKAGGPQPWGQR